MDLDLDEQQRTLRDEARRFLTQEAATTYAREMFTDDRGVRDDVWKQMAEIGWIALPFNEASGGLGMGTIALTILLAEMGRVTLPGPYLSTVLGGLAIERSGGHADLLARITSGDATVSFTDAPDVIVTGDRLTGQARFVLDGAHAEQVVVLARTADGTSVAYLAEPSERIVVQTMDETRRTAHLRFDDTVGIPLGGDVQSMLDLAALAIAADSLGGAERVLELAVDYAKQREQFGRPIGSFQAIKHKAADMHVDVESLRAAVFYAAWAIEAGAPDASRAASVAKAWAADAYRNVAKDGMQIHGGIGFTWEHDMHLFFKRAKFNENAFGDAATHRERIAALLAP